METSPINNVLPATPAGADSTLQPGTAGAPEHGFQAMMARQLEALVPGTAPAEPAILPGTDDDESLAQEIAPGSDAGTAAAESLLALLPQVAPQANMDARGAYAPGTDETGASAAQALAPGAPDARAATARAVLERSAPLAGADAEAQRAEAPAFLTGQAELPQVTQPEAHPAPLHAPSAAGAGTGAAATPPRIDVPLGLPGWSTELAHRLVWIANEKQQVAELHINPPHLGPIDITLTISDDQASAVFASPHGMVRETLESALPRLREVLAENGIQLGQASVTADSPRDGQAHAQPRHSALARAWALGTDDGSGAGGGMIPARRPAGLVDLFA